MTLLLERLKRVQTNQSTQHQSTAAGKFQTILHGKRTSMCHIPSGFVFALQKLKETKQRLGIYFSHWSMTQ